MPTKERAAEVAEAEDKHAVCMTKRFCYTRSVKSRQVGIAGSLF